MKYSSNVIRSIWLHLLASESQVTAKVLAIDVGADVATSSQLLRYMLKVGQVDRVEVSRNRYAYLVNKSCKIPSRTTLGEITAALEAKENR